MSMLNFGDEAKFQDLDSDLILQVKVTFTHNCIVSFFFSLEHFFPLFLSVLLSPYLPMLFCFPADSERSLHDCAEWPCSGLYIWGCHVRFGGAAKPGDAFKSQQFSLPWTKAYSFCGLAGLPSERVGDFTQLPQGLHLTCKCSVWIFPVRHILKSWSAAVILIPSHTSLDWKITPWELSKPPSS